MYFPHHSYLGLELLNVVMNGDSIINTIFLPSNLPQLVKLVDTGIVLNNIQQYLGILKIIRLRWRIAVIRGFLHLHSYFTLKIHYLFSKIFNISYLDLRNDILDVAIKNIKFQIKLQNFSYTLKHKSRNY